MKCRSGSELSPYIDGVGDKAESRVMTNSGLIKRFVFVAKHPFRGKTPFPFIFVLASTTYRHIETA